jgi:hypothetical protein
MGDISQRLESLKDGYGLLFSSADGKKDVIVYWSYGGDLKSWLRLTSVPKSYRIVDAFGSELQVEQNDNELEIQITEVPRFLIINY